MLEHGKVIRHMHYVFGFIFLAFIAIATMIGRAYMTRKHYDDTKGAEMDA